MMRSLFPLLIGASTILATSLSAQIVESIGTFDSGTDGWAVSGFSDTAGRSVSAASGQLAYTPGSGYQWAIQNNDLRTSLGTSLDAIGASDQILLSFEVSYEWSEWSTTGGAWVQVAEVVYNSGATEFNSITRQAAVDGGLLTDTSNPGFPGGTDIASGSYTTTLTWDVTSIMSGATSSDSYAELAIGINFSGDITPGNYYFDNIALTGITSPVPEPSTYALLASLGVFGFLVWRRRRGMR